MDISANGMIVGGVAEDRSISTVRPKTRKDVYELKLENRKLRLFLLMSSTIGGVMLVLAIIMGVLFMANYNENSAMRADYDNMVYKLDTATKGYSDLLTITKEVDAQNEALVAANQALEARKELYDKHAFAILDKSGNRTDIDYDHIARLEALCEEKGFDPDMVLATIMVESTGRANAKSSISTAKGLGQFLDGTSKFVYTDLLGKSNWNPSVAYDPGTAIEMTLAYYDYLYDSRGSLDAAILGYRGLNDPGYVSKLNGYLKTVGKSISSIDAELKRKS